MKNEGTDEATLTFGDLKIGDHFIGFPAPGDNDGHGGYLGAHVLYRKTKQTASGMFVPEESGAAIDGRGVVAHFPYNMQVIQVLGSLVNSCAP